MMRGSRRPRVELPESGERILAWADLGAADSGRTLIASTHALYIPDTSDLRAAGPQVRIPWTDIDRATWADPVLHIEGRSPEGARQWRLELAAAGRVPELVRERVMASIVVSEHVEIAEGAGARIVGRRASVDSDVTWTVTFDPGLDPADPHLRKAAQEALDDLRDTLGV